MLILFLKSVLIGLSIAIPVGPIAVLCIKNSIHRGWKMGIAVGLGAAITEAFYGFVVSGGFVAITNFLTDYVSQIRLIGSLILIVIGLFEIHHGKKLPTEEIKMKKSGFFKTVIFVALFSLTSPMTVVFFASIFASMGGTTLTLATAHLTVIGVFCGSFGWSVFLSGVLSKIRHNIAPKWIVRMRVTSGLMIAGFGVNGIINCLT